MRIKGAVLVHNPALDLIALAHAEDGPAPDPLARIATALGLNAGASEMDSLAAIVDMTGAEPTHSVSTEKVAELMAELRETKHQLRSLETEIAVDTAVAAGRVPAAMRDWATTLCMSDPAAFEVFAAEQEAKHAYLFRSLDSVEPPKARTHSAELESEIARQLDLDPARLRD